MPAIVACRQELAQSGSCIANNQICPAAARMNAAFVTISPLENVVVPISIKSAFVDVVAKIDLQR